MKQRHLALFSLFSLPLIFASCGKKEEAKPQAKVEEAKPAVVATTAPEPQKIVPETPKELEPAAHLGDFGSDEPIERVDLPQRGILTFDTKEKNDVFMPAEHWEQYNFPFVSKRWGRYKVRVNYTLKASTLGVQFKIGDQRLKKQLKHTSGVPKQIYLGEVTIAQPGDQFMALYTPNGVGFATFFLHDISLVPASESDEQTVTQAADGTLELLAKHATTWSENMRYEPKEEKNCLGFWTDKDDFAEWEFKVDKPGKYNVTVHQGCGAGGGSEIAVMFGEKQLNFVVQDTGGFQKWVPVSAGELQIEKPGTYRLAVKPQTKNGNAIMDVQKIVLAPVS